jgi:hypothetical protein
MDLEEVLCSGKVKVMVMIPSEYTMVITNKSNKRFHRKCVGISRYKRMIRKNREPKKVMPQAKRTTEEGCASSKEGSIEEI